jgi:hypothetical protein
LADVLGMGRFMGIDIAAGGQFQLVDLGLAGSCPW